MTTRTEYRYECRKCQAGFCSVTVSVDPGIACYPPKLCMYDREHAPEWAHIGKTLS